MITILFNTIINRIFIQIYTILDMCEFVSGSDDSSYDSSDSNNPNITTAIFPLTSSARKLTLAKSKPTASQSAQKKPQPLVSFQLRGSGKNKTTVLRRRQSPNHTRNITRGVGGVTRKRTIRSPDEWNVSSQDQPTTSAASGAEPISVRYIYIYILELTRTHSIILLIMYLTHIMNTFLSCVCM